MLPDISKISSGQQPNDAPLAQNIRLSFPPHSEAVCSPFPRIRGKEAFRFQKRLSFPISFPLVSRFPAYTGAPETRIYFRPWTLSQPAPTALFASLETWPTETSIASAIAVALERPNSTQLRKTASGSACL